MPNPHLSRRCCAEAVEPRLLGDGDGTGGDAVVVADVAAVDAFAAERGGGDSDGAGEAKGWQTTSSFLLR